MHTPEKIVSSFISYLKEQEQYESLAEIISLLEKELYRNQDITVITAVELEAKEKKELESSLFKKWGEHQVVFAVDPILLSGTIVKFQDRIIDTSGKNALTDLKHELI